MKITIGGVEYTQIRNLSFAPETDITGGSIPVNQFFVEIKTDNTIPLGVNAYLYDDADVLWAKYWITDVGTPNAGWSRVTAQSIILLLDRFTMPAAVYDNEPVANVLDSIFSTITAVYPSETIYTLDAALSNAVVTGYCPEQKARDRLLWVVFCIGGYVKTYFNEYAEIVALDSTETLVPENKTFWKPEIDYSDYVTAVVVRAYTYTQGTPQTVDKWVQVGNNYYIETYQDYTLTNPDIPITVTDNVVKIEKVTLVNQANVTAILAVLSQYYFKRVEMSADLLNDGEYLPGDKCIVSSGDMLVSGFIKSATFTFGGKGKRSQVRLVQSDSVEADNLTIQYLYDGNILTQRKYLLPVGYVYSIVNPYLDITSGLVRRIYRPLNVSASGTMVDGGVIDTEDTEIAIEAQNQIVYVISVDSVTESGEVVKIG